ncbi:metal-dependent hydrolase [bacterium]|nr:metal-dependent hydrolase [bacterium]
MASGKRHLFVGLLSVYFFTFIISNYFFQPSFLDVLLYVVIGLLFALWPDVDTKSLGQKVFYMIFFLTDLYLIFTLQYKLAAFFGLIIILPVLANHRGWTHTRAAMILVPLPILLYPMITNRTLDCSNLPFYAIAVTGYFSHLLIDGQLFKK